MNCPRCRAPRGSGTECLRCGVIFAKYEARAARQAEAEASAGPADSHPGADLRSPELAQLWPDTPTFDAAAADAETERRFRLWALPGALAVMLLVTASPMLRGLTRIFMSMWVHELGHAVSAWASGFFAIPGPWMTPTAEQRTWGPTLFFLGLVALTGFHGYRRRSALLLAGAAALLLTQLVCTFALGPAKAKAFITFMGDGGCFVLGALLMATFYVGPEHALRRGQVRWGLLVIGAAAYVDALRTWWAARTDVDAIPFGRQERAGLSDPSRLVDWYGWSIDGMVATYLVVALLCFLGLAALYLWGLRQVRQEASSPRPLPEG